MTGCCIDSWHAAAATDNAAALALEVIRIIKALGLRPHRTTRVGLRGAQERGRLGSRACVAAHPGEGVGDANGLSVHAHLEPAPEYERLAGYFNRGYGRGKIRGVYLQGDEAVRPTLRAWLAPFGGVGT